MNDDVYVNTILVIISRLDSVERNSQMIRERPLERERVMFAISNEDLGERYL